MGLDVAIHQVEASAVTLAANLDVGLGHHEHLDEDFGGVLALDGDEGEATGAAAGHGFDAVSIQRTLAVIAKVPDRAAEGIMLDAGCGLHVHEQAVVAVAVRSAAHIDAGDGVLPEVGRLVDPFAGEQGGGFVILLDGFGDGRELRELIVAHDLLALVSQEELLFAGLGSFALVEALGHHGPFVTDELRLEDDGVDKRTPAEGGGLLAGRVHQTRGLEEAGEL